MRSDWPLIRFRASTPRHPWMIDCGLINGKRIRYSCRTKEEALGRAAELRQQRRRNGEESLAPARLDEDTKEALALLAPHGITLTQAAKVCLANLEVITAPRPVTGCVEELIRAKAQDGASQGYLQDLRTRLLRGFAVQFGDLPIHEVTHSQIEDWLRARPDWSPQNRNNYRTVIGTLFGFALARGYILKDPCVKVARAKVVPVKPGILSVDEARALLGSAGEDIRASLALLLFAGLRPEAELLRLDWSAINLEDRSIDITVSKNTASHRFVAISDNLLKWLEPPKGDSRVVPWTGACFHWKVRKARAVAARELQRAGIPCPALEDWPNDCCRHSFASYHYGAFKNAHETAEQMGHAGGLRMFFRHYRNRVREAEAVAFWQLVPDSKLPASATKY